MACDALSKKQRKQTTWDPRIIPKIKPNVFQKPTTSENNVCSNKGGTQSTEEAEEEKKEGQNEKPRRK